jgi:hypothetical protein
MLRIAKCYAKHIIEQKETNNDKKEHRTANKGYMQ